MRGMSEQQTTDQANEKSAEQTTEQPTEQPTEQTTRQQAQPEGGRSRPPIDISDLVWRVGNIVATVVRVVALLCAVVLVADIILTLVGVNTSNVVARFVGGASGVVVLAFRDLFLLTDPSIAKVVNFGLAAVFWVLVGEFVSRLVRFVAARLA